MDLEGKRKEREFKEKKEPSPGGHSRDIAIPTIALGDKVAAPPLDNPTAKRSSYETKCHSHLSLGCYGAVAMYVVQKDPFIAWPFGTVNFTAFRLGQL